MKSFSLLFIIIFCLFLLLPLKPALSETVYVTDSFEITLRAGPGGEYKIIAMLKSDTPLEVLEDSETWVKVRTNRGKEGWVLKRYITKKIPNSILIETLKKGNQELRDRIQNLKKINLMLKEKNLNQEKSLKKEQNQYTKLLKEHNALKKDAANVVQLKKEYIKTKENLKKALEKNAILLKENDKLKFSENMKWFLSGAGVLIFGWIIGLIMGRYKKKQQSRLY